VLITKKPTTKANSSAVIIKWKDKYCIGVYVFSFPTERKFFVKFGVKKAASTAILTFNYF
jgi:hypothetical protein